MNYFTDKERKEIEGRFTKIAESKLGGFESEVVSSRPTRKLSAAFSNKQMHLPVNDKFDCSIHGSSSFSYEPVAGGFNKIKKCGRCIRELAEKLFFEEQDKLKQENIQREILKSGVSKRNQFFKLLSLNHHNTEQKKMINDAVKMSVSIQAGEVTQNIINTGTTGTGKTLIWSALVSELIRSGFTANIIKVSELIRSLKDTWRRDSDLSETKVIEFFAGLDLLVIDEIGVQYGSDTERLFISEIIDARYNDVKPTVLVSNLSIEEIQSCVGERVVDRLREDGGKLIGLKFDSLRGAV